MCSRLLSPHLFSIARADLISDMNAAFYAQCGGPPTTSCAQQFWAYATEEMYQLASQYHDIATDPNFSWWCFYNAQECQAFMEAYNEVMAAYQYALGQLEGWLS